MLWIIDSIDVITPWMIMHLWRNKTQQAIWMKSSIILNSEELSTLTFKSDAAETVTNSAQNNMLYPWILIVNSPSHWQIIPPELPHEVIINIINMVYRLSIISRSNRAIFKFPRIFFDCLPLLSVSLRSGFIFNGCMLRAKLVQAAVGTKRAETLNSKSKTERQT